jgi:hypothetical protein
LNEWDGHYATLTQPEAYGGDASYRLAAEWVKDCQSVEDWGCGKGWLRSMVDPKAYIGVDGSRTPFADVIADLTTYRSQCEGLVLRHVLEHSRDWVKILDNAVASFTKRLCIVLFTPLADQTTVLRTEPDYGDVPVISFRLTDLLDRLGDETVKIRVVGDETVIRYAR